MKKIRVLLADDHNVVREGLRAMLASAEAIEVTGEAADGWQAVRLAKETVPDVVLMDVSMPSLDGLGATREILRQVPGIKVLVLTSFGEEDCIEQLLGAGAAGYLVKQSAATELVGAIQEVHRGRMFFSPAVVKRWRDQGHAILANGRFVRRNSKLTARELEVLRLVALGFSNKEAAANLGISIKTVEKHRQQVMNKLNIHEAAGLTRYALSQRLVDATAPTLAGGRAEISCDEPTALMSPGPEEEAKPRSFRGEP